ncbi:MAG: AraC family transcriptional regulator [Firmicutes bacterium]|nr:AraC family transcriptional regulator [Bacillota bacterium]
MRIYTNSKLEEQRSHGREGFPFVVYSENYEDYQDGTIGIHWHEEFEFNLILSGEIEAQVDGRTYHLQAGDGIFFNSNALHMSYSVSPDQDVKQHSILFLPEFLAATNTSIYIKGVAPLICRKELSAYPLYSTIPEDAAILKLLNETSILDQYKDGRNDLAIHIKICIVWEMLQSIFAQAFDTKPSLGINSIHQERTKRMLSFIQEHYDEKIVVDDIAASADISRSECFRCFRTQVRNKPIEYLNEYRLAQAAKRLMATSKSISEIAQECGFDHQSYFGKQFKARYHMTPAAYRKQIQP